MPLLRVPAHRGAHGKAEAAAGLGGCTAPAMPRSCRGAGQPKEPIFTSPTPLRGRIDPGLHRAGQTHPTRRGAAAEQDSQGCVWHWLSLNILPTSEITRLPLAEGLSGVNTSPALHSPASALTRRTGVTTDAPGSRPSRGSRRLPSHGGSLEERANPRFLLPCALFRQQPRPCPSPWCQTPFPSALPTSPGPGVAAEEGPRAAHLRVSLGGAAAGRSLPRAGAHRPVRETAHESPPRSWERGGDSRGKG